MDDLVPKLLTFPPVPAPAEPLTESQYDLSIRAISQLLTSTAAAKLTSGLSTGEDVLDVLDPSTHSLAYLHVLFAHIEAVRSGSKSSSAKLPSAVLYGGRLWPRIAIFLQCFDPIQVRYGGSQFRFVMEIVGAGARQTQNPLPAIPLIRDAILRLDPTSSTLTSTHHMLIALCLQGKSFQAALPILEKPIYHIPAIVDKFITARSSQYLCSLVEPSWVYLNPDHGLTRKLNSRTYLEYHLYAAMVYMGLKHWEKAMTFLETVLLTPTASVTSAIMVEAYKKWVLVGLLVNGKAPTMPKGANKNVIRNIRALAKPYDCLVGSFTSGKLAHFKGDLELGQQFWLSDCNFGLVIQVYDAFRKFAVLRLADVYAAVPLREVARRTSPDASDLVETASYISTLIAAGDLRATLTQSQDLAGSATLRFLPSSFGPHTEPDLHRDLEASKSELGNLLKHLQDSDHRLEISKEYIDRLRFMKKQKEQGAKAGGDSYGHAMDELDEDVMAEL